MPRLLWGISVLASSLPTSWPSPRCHMPTGLVLEAHPGSICCVGCTLARGCPQQLGSQAWKQLLVPPAEAGTADTRCYNAPGASQSLVDLLL